MRWRNIKNRDNTIKTETKTLPYASLSDRIKAFIIDMFMIMMPLLYITTYFFLDGKDDYQSSMGVILLIEILYGVIIIALWTIKGQSVGMKAYEIILIDDKSSKNPTALSATLRYMYFILTASSIIGLLVPFFRKDKKTLQDILSKTSIINK